MTQRILHNKVRCTKCHDVIESFDRHDFKWCSCQSIAVDGGRDYLKRCGDIAAYEELSEHTDAPEIPLPRNKKLSGGEIAFLLDLLISRRTRQDTPRTSLCPHELLTGMQSTSPEKSKP